MFMFTVIVQVKKPKNQVRLENHLWNVHFPLVKAIPGIKGIRFHKVVEARGGEPTLYGLIELYFDGKEAFERAMVSEEAKKAIQDGSKLETEAGTAIRFDYYCETTNA